MFNRAKVERAAKVATEALAESCVGKEDCDAQLYATGAGLDAIILCQDGECRFVDADAVEEMEKAKKKAMKKKKKRKKKQKEQDAVEKMRKDLLKSQLGQSADTTVLLDRDQVRNYFKNKIMPLSIGYML